MSKIMTLFSHDWCVILNVLQVRVVKVWSDNSRLTEVIRASISLSPQCNERETLGDIPDATRYVLISN